MCIGTYVDRYNEALIELPNAEQSPFFIMSCSTIKPNDSLTMWRLYGDDYRGVCIEYEVDGDKLGGDYKLAKVSYGTSQDKHPELYFLVNLQNQKIGDCRFKLRHFNVWKHFFKPHEYSDEKEVRLLVKNPKKQNYKWILTSGNGIICPLIEFDSEKMKDLPLKLTRITLGGRNPEYNQNLNQLKCFIDYKKCEIFKNVPVDMATISTYR